MSVSPTIFTTGPSILPDVGTLAYNGVTFSPLFVSNVHATPVKDEANRAIKYIEYVISVEGYVSQSPGNASIKPQMATLETLLSQPCGTLTYKGRGFDLFVQTGIGSFGFGKQDVAWGPMPDLIDFQPLGGGLSAFVKWTVTTRLVWPGGTNPRPGNSDGGLLQFNCETTVSYSEDYFSSMSIRGTMEIPLNRQLNMAPGVPKGSLKRNLVATVDQQRQQLDYRIFQGIDLARFKVTRRNYNVSRDKRTMEFDIEVTEKPFMDLPPGCTVAHGSYSVRQQKSGPAAIQWMCTLRATYVVRADGPRRLALWAFLALMRLRVNQSVLGYIPTLTGPQQDPQLQQAIKKAQDNAKVPPPNGPNSLQSLWDTILKFYAGPKPVNVMPWEAIAIDEGLYEDSKQISFSCAWRLTTTVDAILAASGVWRKLPENDASGANLWATTMKDISGSTSWLSNAVDPGADMVVDFGGG